MSDDFKFIHFWNDEHEKQIRYYNHLKEFVLDGEGINTLMRAVPVAQAAWVASDGSPRAITVPFALLNEDYVYFTAEESQAIVQSLRKDPRISMCWGGPGGAATVRGQAEVISDPALTASVCEASAKQRYPDDPAKASKLASKLDSPTRVSIKVSKDKFITFSGAGLPRD